MTIELRDLGDRKTVVVFTDESKIAQRLRDRKSCIRIVPYEQEQYSRKRTALVGYDFYFPKKNKKGLLRLGAVEK